MGDGMVDREKVIKGLAKLKENSGCIAVYDCDCKTCPYDRVNRCCSQILEDAIALLKAQEPVEPISTEDDDWICGACNNSVVGTTEIDEGGFVPVRFNYCQNCGRAVKWDE